MVARKHGRAVINAGESPPKLPAEAAYVWAIYCALDATRGAGMGPGPITFTEMLAYSTLHGFDWTRFEVSAIRTLDRLFLAHIAETQKTKSGAHRP